MLKKFPLLSRLEVSALIGRWEWIVEKVGRIKVTIVLYDHFNSTVAGLTERVAENKKPLVREMMREWLNVFSLVDIEKSVLAIRRLAIN